MPAPDQARRDRVRHAQHDLVADDDGVQKLLARQAEVLGRRQRCGDYDSPGMGRSAEVRVVVLVGVPGDTVEVRGRVGGQGRLRADHSRRSGAADRSDRVPDLRGQLQRGPGDLAGHLVGDEHLRVPAHMSRYRSVIPCRVRRERGRRGVAPVLDPHGTHASR